MRIGPLHVTWQTSRRARMVACEVRDELRSVEVRNSIARLARSEVKNYLGELAEVAEMPFPSAAGFLRSVRALIGEMTTTGLNFEPDESDEPADDGPFVLIDIVTLPNGHTMTCTCPDKYEGLEMEPGDEPDPQ